MPPTAATAITTSRYAPTAQPPATPNGAGGQDRRHRREGDQRRATKPATMRRCEIPDGVGGTMPAACPDGPGAEASTPMTCRSMSPRASRTQRVTIEPRTQLGDPGAPARADHQLGGVLGARDRDQRDRDVVRDHLHEAPAELGQQGDVAVDRGVAAGRAGRRRGAR